MLKIFVSACLFCIFYSLSGCGAEYGKWNGGAVSDLQSPIVQQKRLAVSSFAMYGSAKHMEYLIPLLAHEDVVVRYHARNSLMSISGQDGGYDQEKWRAIQSRVSSKEPTTAIMRQEARRDAEQDAGTYYSHRIWDSKHGAHIEE